jgi:Ring finger domain
MTFHLANPFRKSQKKLETCLKKIENEELSSQHFAPRPKSNQSCSFKLTNDVSDFMETKLKLDKNDDIVVQSKVQTMDALNLLEDIVEFLEEKSRSSKVYADILEFADLYMDTPLRFPRASPAAISKLPLTRIFPFDRIKHKDYNVKCTICMERLIDGVALSRLPCGHVYHINCTVSWLGRSCACPDCRYELATMDPVYEIGRRQRMRDRPIHDCGCKTKGMHRCSLPEDEMLKNNSCLILQTPLAHTVTEARKTSARAA